MPSTTSTRSPSASQLTALRNELDSRREQAIKAEARAEAAQAKVKELEQQLRRRRLDPEGDLQEQLDGLITLLIEEAEDLLDELEDME